MSDVVRVSARRTEWVWGGALLIASAVPPLAVQRIGGPVSAGVQLVAQLAFAAAMLVFALGRDSVVARRPLGVTAFVVLAAMAFSWYAWLLVPASAIMASADVRTWVSALSYTASAVQLAAAIVAAMQVARAGVVPRRLRWMPLIALIVVAGPQVLMAILAVSGPALVYGDAAEGMFAIVTLSGFVGVVGLGVVAIVAGVQPRRAAEASVQVFPPVDEPRTPR